MNVVNHLKPSALEVASERWGMPEPDIAMVTFINNIRRFQGKPMVSAPSTPIIQRRHEDGFWQRISGLPAPFQRMELRKARAHITCRICWDTGVIAAPDIYGELDYEPCPRCIVSTHTEPLDERAF